MPTIPIVVDPTGAIAGSAAAVQAMRAVRLSAIQMAGADGLGRLLRMFQVNSAAAYALRRNFFALGAAFTGALGFRQTINTIGEYDRALRAILAIMPDAAANQRLLEDAIRNSAQKWSYSITETANAVLELARAGTDTKTAIGVLPHAIELATAANVDLVKSAEALISIQGQFQMSYSETGRIADVISKAANDSITTVEQMMDAFKYVGPNAHNASLSLEETAAALEVLAKAGIRGTLAGTALRGLLASLVAPTPRALRELEDLNLQIQDLNPEAKSLQEIFDALGQSEMSTADSVQIFTRRVSTAAMSLKGLKDLLREYTEANKHSAGEAARVASLMQDAIPFAFDRIRNAFQELDIVLSENGLGQMIRDFATTFQGAVLVLAGSDYRIQRVTDAMHSLAGALAGVLAGLAAIIGLNAGLHIMTFTLRSLQAALVGTAGAMFAINPVGWIAAALAVSVGLFIKYKDEVITLGGTTARVVDFMVALFEVLAEKTNAALHDFYESWKNVWDAITEGTKVMANGVLNILVDMYEAMGALWEHATALFDMAKDAVKMLTDPNVKFTDPNTWIGPALGLAAKHASALQSSEDAVAAVFNKARNGGMHDFVGEALTFWKELPETIRQYVPGINEVLTRAEERYRAHLQFLAEAKENADKSAAVFDPNRVYDDMLAKSNKLPMTDEARKAIDHFRDLVKEEQNALSTAFMLNGERDRELKLIDARNMALESAGRITEDDIKGLEELIRLRQQAEVDFKFADTLRQLQEEHDLIYMTNDAMEQQAALIRARNEALEMGGKISDLQEKQLTNEIRIQQAMRKSKQLAMDMSQALADAATTFLTTGNSISDVLKDLWMQLERMVLQQVVFAPLVQGLGSILSPALGTSLFGVPASAHGNVFSGGNIVPFARGGVVNRPTLFPMANGAGLMGEAGPEAVMPLRRDSRGNLGVSGGSSAPIYVNITTPNADSFRKSQGQIARTMRRAMNGR